MYIAAIQGGTLAPFLFILYINDIQRKIEKSKYHLFIDDATACITV